MEITEIITSTETETYGRKLNERSRTTMEITEITENNGNKLHRDRSIRQKIK